MSYYFIQDDKKKVIRIQTPFMILFQFEPLDYVKEEIHESNQTTTCHLQTKDAFDETEYYNNTLFKDKPKICLVFKRQCKHKRYFTYFKDS